MAYGLFKARYDWSFINNRLGNQMRYTCTPANKNYLCRAYDSDLSPFLYLFKRLSELSFLESVELIKKKKQLLK